jgi:hypothetical protein
MINVERREKAMEDKRRSQSRGMAGRDQEVVSHVIKSISHSRKAACRFRLAPRLPYLA